MTSQNVLFEKGTPVGFKRERKEIKDAHEKGAKWKLYLSHNSLLLEPGRHWTGALMRAHGGQARRLTIAHPEQTMWERFFVVSPHTWRGVRDWCDWILTTDTGYYCNARNTLHALRLPRWSAASHTRVLFTQKALLPDSQPFSIEFAFH